MSSKEYPLKFTTSVEGVEVAEGTYKTSSGVIRIPKSRMLEKEREAAAEKSAAQKKEPEKESKKEAPVKKLPQQSQQRAPEEVSFETPMGTMKAPYSPVINQENFIVLGLLPQSFIPVSYQENAKLVFEVYGSSVERCHAT